MQKIEGEIKFDDFLKVDIRVGEIVKAEEFPKARKPSYRLKIDFGDEIGIKDSSVQAKKDYMLNELLGMQVVAVINFPKKNIAGFMSEVLVLGVPGPNKEMFLLTPSRKSKKGGRVY